MSALGPQTRVLVTGGTQGIGLATALALRARGAQVVVCGQTARTLEGNLEVIACDLTRAVERERLIVEVSRRMGGLSVLINNAAVQYLSPVEALELGLLEREVALNLVAPIHLTALALPVLKAQPRAAVVNVTSGLALVPKKSAPVYCGTKAGLRSFTQSLRAQCAGSSVRVLEVLPPVTATAMTAGRNAGAATPESVAHALVAGLEGDATEVRVGKTRLLFALHRLSPDLAARMMRDA